MTQISTQNLEQYLPVREVKTTHGSISGIFMFNNEPVKFESTLERDFLVRLSTYDHVLNVISQPMSIDFQYPTNDRTYQYTPDFLVNYKGSPYPYRKSQLIEVKPYKKLKENITKWKPKFKKATQCSKELDFVFHIYDEHRIRDQRWKNAMFLRRYEKMDFDEEVSNWIINNLKNAELMTFDYLLKRHFLTRESQANGISHIWHLVSTKRIVCDLSLPFTIHTEFWINENE